MLNNLTNFSNLISSRRTTSSASGNDLVVLGVNDPRTPGIYQPVAIKVSDLIGGGAGVTQIIAGSGISVSPVGGTGVVTITNTGGSLPSFLEYNNTDKTVWNNGQGDVISNTSFGDNTLRVNTSGSNNAAFGYQALRVNTTGFGNSALGTSILFNNTTGGFNVAVGVLSAFNNISGNYNIAIGNSALYSNQSQSHLIGIGNYLA